MEDKKILLVKTQEVFIMLQLLAATKNKHKIAEFQEMLDRNNLSVTILSPDTIRNFPELIKFSGFSEKMLFISCTNSYEIVIFTGIIKL